jgi:hypothetical protein
VLEPLITAKLVDAFEVLEMKINVPGSSAAGEN